MDGKFLSIDWGKSYSIRELLTFATRSLASISPTPSLDSQILLSHVLGCSRGRLLAHDEDILTPALVESFLALVRRRANLEPVAYLVGYREFYGIELVVDRRVLIPRPETELLVDRVLEWVRSRATPCRIADIGTGSGAIAIALAHHLPEGFPPIYATDCSTDALAVAATNVARHHCGERVVLLQGDLVEPLPQAVDCLVANLPYLMHGEAEVGVARHEPAIALEGGGEDGLDLYRRLVTCAPLVLQPGGALFLEMNPAQFPILSPAVQAAFPGATLHGIRDLAGFERVLEVRLPLRANA